jgi:hypothetical protein
VWCEDSQGNAIPLISISGSEDEDNSQTGEFHQKKGADQSANVGAAGKASKEQAKPNQNNQTTAGSGQNASGSDVAGGSVILTFEQGIARLWYWFKRQVKARPIGVPLGCLSLAVNVVTIPIIALALYESKAVNNFFCDVRYLPPKISHISIDRQDPLFGDAVTLTPQVDVQCGGEVVYDWNHKDWVSGSGPTFTLDTSMVKRKPPFTISDLSLTIKDRCERKSDSFRIPEPISVQKREYPRPELKEIVPNKLQANMGQEITFTAVACDPGGNKLTYEWTCAAPGFVGESDDYIARLDTSRIDPPTSPLALLVELTVRNEFEVSERKAVMVTITPNQTGTGRRRSIKYIVKVAKAANAIAPSPAPSPAPTPSTPTPERVTPEQNPSPVTRPPQGDSPAPAPHPSPTTRMTGIKGLFAPGSGARRFAAWLHLGRK